MSVLRKYNPTTEQWEILQGGVQGLQGPPVALSKGTVTTGAPGTNADFTVTGTPPDQRLNLTVPRGDVGPPGPTFGSDGSIIAAGRPDLPATLDSATQAEVSSAPTGTLFRSTDGAGVGAWMWMKRPVGWAVVDGGTTVRSVAASITGTFTLQPTVGAATIIRNAATVTISLVNLMATDAGTNTQLSWQIPPGYRPPSDMEFRANYAPGDTSTRVIIYSQGRLIRYSTAIKGSMVSVTMTFQTSDPWPTVLPGTPA